MKIRLLLGCMGTLALAGCGGAPLCWPKAGWSSSATGKRVSARTDVRDMKRPPSTPKRHCAGYGAGEALAAVTESASS